LIHPINFNQKTGFEQVMELVSARCLSDMGRTRVGGLSFSNNLNQVERLLGETREFLTILESGRPFPSQDYLDLSPVLDRIQTPGSWILPEELVFLGQSLNTISECLHFFRQPSTQLLQHLQSKVAGLEVPVHIIREIARILDEKGHIRDNASEALATIRKEIRAKTNSNEKVIQQLLTSARKAGWTADHAEVTISDGRLVLPLLAAHKRKIRGVVHDESATGHTVFLEPEACMEINNEIRELESAERREIIKILTLFSDMLRPERETLLKAYDFLGEMDFIRAKALLAMELGCTKPVLHDTPVIRWKTARHPLLFLSLKTKGRTLVPLDIELNADRRILVISGPNAGGKSVCLKTAGLLQYMLQCGLLVPMDADSETGLFDQLFIDIGDEQSLENDLSTYSSHLLNLKYFIEHSNPATLFLVDELGTGTDPSLGGALAEAALERLSETGAFGVVTTHYSNLKLLEGRVPGIVNGAMLFDMDRLQPLFKLSVGKPGSSFTFEIAHRIGFPETVIDMAKAKTGKTHLDFERQLQEVEAEKLRLEKQLTEFQVADKFLGELIAKYEQVKSDLEKSKRDILERAREEARNLLEQSNRLIERTVREIKESQADKEKTKAVRLDVAEFREKLNQPETTVSRPEKPIVPPSHDGNPPGNWKKGDFVSVEGREGIGKILLIKGQNATIDFDGLKISTSISKLKPAQGQTHKLRGAYSSIISELNEKAVNFKLTLDLRGKSADEALQMTQKYLDDAYLLRIKEVSILHGKGEGILRKVIRDYLSRLDEVETFRDEDLERGGAGITRVLLR
jgi:DNA mismatch repair protein MutS2